MWKKDALLTAATWSLNVRCASRMTPRLLIEGDSVTESVCNARADDVDVSDSLRTSSMRELGGLGLRMIEREIDVRQPVV